MKQTILIVDDAPENLDILKALLEERYNVKAAPGGEVALKIARSSSPPDLVLLDVVMPGMDGFEVFQELRNHSATAGIPVIFITGAGDNDSRFECLEEECIKLNKPIKPGMLRETVEMVLARYER